jgi:hypothetical protein
LTNQNFPAVHYRRHNRAPLNPTLSHMYQIHILAYYCLPSVPMSPTQTFTFTSSNQNCVGASHLSPRSHRFHYRNISSYVTFCNLLAFFNEGCYPPSSTTKAWGPSLVHISRLLIRYFRTKTSATLTAPLQRPVSLDTVKGS